MMKGSYQRKLTYYRSTTTGSVRVDSNCCDTHLNKVANYDSMSNNCVEMGKELNIMV